MVYDLDRQVRLAAFQFLSEQKKFHNKKLPRKILETGFEFKGTRVPIVGPQGIFKPKILPEMPLSITTIPVIEGEERPYEDEVSDDGLIRYAYRGIDPNHRDNTGLRLALKRGAPLIYLYGIRKGIYLAEFPVYIVHDNPGALYFTVTMDDAQYVLREMAADYEVADARRRYVTVETQHRLHQASFRERVIEAYREQCAVCSLKHEEFLEAAHILPDGHPKGAPIISNGLALCNLHHTAFDRNILGIRPNFKIELRIDILREKDGPMLKHGLQGFQGSQIFIPKSKHLQPNPDFLAERYEAFRGAE